VGRVDQGGLNATRTSIAVNISIQVKRIVMEGVEKSRGVQTCDHVISSGDRPGVNVFSPNWLMDAEYAIVVFRHI